MVIFCLLCENNSKTFQKKEASSFLIELDSAKKQRLALLGLRFYFCYFNETAWTAASVDVWPFDMDMPSITVNLIPSVKMKTIEILRLYEDAVRQHKYGESR